MPPVERVGVDLVTEVGPWESLKLEVLNALHTAAAHFGLRYDLSTVDRVAADPSGSEFLQAVAGEIRDVVSVPDGARVDDYIATTMIRFANTGLGHRCAQIATDTSQKLPPRLLGTVRRRLASGLPIDALAQVLALWAWSTRGVDAAGRPRAVNDPLASRFVEITSEHSRDPVAFIDALLAIDSIFGDLSGDELLRAEVLRRFVRVLGDTATAG
jgi:fructuronate reductase